MPCYPPLPVFRRYGRLRTVPARKPAGRAAHRHLFLLLWRPILTGLGRSGVASVLPVAKQTAPRFSHLCLCGALCALFFSLPCIAATQQPIRLSSALACPLLVAPLSLERRCGNCRARARAATGALCSSCLDFMAHCLPPAPASHASWVRTPSLGALPAALPRHHCDFPA